MTVCIIFIEQSDKRQRQRDRQTERETVAELGLTLVLCVSAVLQ